MPKDNFILAMGHIYFHHIFHPFHPLFTRFAQSSSAMLIHTTHSHIAYRHCTTSTAHGSLGNFICKCYRLAWLRWIQLIIGWIEIHSSTVMRFVNFNRTFSHISKNWATQTGGSRKAPQTFTTCK